MHPSMDHPWPLKELDPELEEVLRLSLQQSKDSGASAFDQRDPGRGFTAPANGTALADGTAGGGGGGGGGKGSPSSSSLPSKAVPTGVVDALASEKHGRWFSFDDRKVRV